MPETPKEQEQDGERKGDEVLRRMLNTPPQPRKKDEGDKEARKSEKKPGKRDDD